MAEKQLASTLRNFRNGVAKMDRGSYLGCRLKETFAMGLRTTYGFRKAVAKSTRGVHCCRNFSTFRKVVAKLSRGIPVLQQTLIFSQWGCELLNSFANAIAKIPWLEIHFLFQIITDFYDFFIPF